MLGQGRDELLGASPGSAASGRGWSQHEPQLKSGTGVERWTREGAGPGGRGSVPGRGRGLEMKSVLGQPGEPTVRGAELCWMIDAEAQPGRGGAKVGAWLNLETLVAEGLHPSWGAKSRRRPRILQPLGVRRVEAGFGTRCGVGSPPGQRLRRLGNWSGAGAQAGSASSLSRSPRGPSAGDPGSFGRAPATGTTGWRAGVFSLCEAQARRPLSARPRREQPGRLERPPQPQSLTWPSGSG